MSSEKFDLTSPAKGENTMNINLYLNVNISIVVGVYFTLAIAIYIIRLFNEVKKFKR